MLLQKKLNKWLIVLVKAITHKDQSLITAKNNGAKVIDLVIDENEDEDVDPFKQIRNR